MSPLTKDKVIEEAAELGERFPDLYDAQLIDAISDILAEDIEYNTAFAELAFIAYNHGEEAAKRSIWYK